MSEEPERIWVAPKAKPLVWRKPHEKADTLAADTIMGRWSVWEAGGAGYVSGPTDRGGKPVAGGVEAAKAAAQADYEHRILGALDAPVDVTALVAAAYARAIAAIMVLRRDEVGDFAAGADCMLNDCLDEIRALTPDDAKAALDDLLKAERAKAYERAAAKAYGICAETRHVRLGLHASDEIRALAQEDGE